MSHCFSRIVSVILPPAGVLINKGCTADFVINIALTTLGYFPGLIHACYIIGPDDDYEVIRSNQLASTPTAVYIITQGPTCSPSPHQTHQSQQLPPKLAQDLPRDHTDGTSVPATAKFPEGPPPKYDSI